MRKRILLLLVGIILLLSGCSGEPTPTEPTDGTTTAPTTVPTTPSTMTSLEAALQLPPEWLQHEIITPEEGVLILHEDISFQNTVIVGDVYITANAEVTFDHVWVKGNLYVHGRLTASRDNHANRVYAYKYERVLCAAYDGIHGEVVLAEDSYFRTGYAMNYITEDALDDAFSAWGKVEPTEQPPTEIRSGDVGVSPFDPSTVRILSGKQTIVDEKIEGDVYITSTGDITFVNVECHGNLYVYGKLHFLDYGMIGNWYTYLPGCIYAYDFVGTCEAFDGVHGQVTGGPVACKNYVVANDALDYAFDTWGKQ